MKDYKTLNEKQRDNLDQILEIRNALHIVFAQKYSDGVTLERLNILANGLILFLSDTNLALGLDEFQCHSIYRGMLERYAELLKENGVNSKTEYVG